MKKNSKEFSSGIRLSYRDKVKAELDFMMLLKKN